MASTAALQVQVHEAGGLQRRQAGTAFADPTECNGGPAGGVSCWKILNIYNRVALATLVGSILAQSCLVVKVTRT